MSGSKILMFENMVLKIEYYSTISDNKYHIYKWLYQKIPIPKVISYEIMNGKSFLLMSKIKGKMSCDEYYLEHPSELLKNIKKSFELLWSVDISNCPIDRSLDIRLQEARYRVDNNLIITENLDPKIFGENGFKNPKELLQWLENNKPKSYEPVLSHGDFCLPNIFFEGDKVSGFVDLGNTGISDKWQDIALCYRSLRDNFNGTYGGKVYPDFDPNILFDILGIDLDQEKLEYYILLDEL